jgi:hypothetical protein
MRTDADDGCGLTKALVDFALRRIIGRDLAGHGVGLMAIVGKGCTG